MDGGDLRLSRVTICWVCKRRVNGRVEFLQLTGRAAPVHPVCRRYYKAVDEYGNWKPSRKPAKEPWYPRDGRYRLPKILPYTKDAIHTEA